MAGFNARKCAVNYVCSNTFKHKYVAQVVDHKCKYKSWDATEAIQLFVNDWFKRHELCPKDVIKHYYYESQSYYFPFTRMVHDRCDQLGCALMQYSKDETFCMDLVCNYAKYIFLGEPVYESGFPCSECPDTCSSKYKGLCTVDKRAPTSPDDLIDVSTTETIGSIVPSSTESSHNQSHGIPTVTCKVYKEHVFSTSGRFKYLRSDSQASKPSLSWFPSFMFSIKLLV